MPTMDLPDTINDETQLDEVMSKGSESLVRLVQEIDGDIIILGIAGKIGVHLGMAAVRAIEKAGVKKKVIGVSRFSDESIRKKLESAGIETIQCDLLDVEAVNRLPRVSNVIFMAGKKFGTSGSEDLTWAMNTILPANVARHFRQSRIVVFSTGNVYALAPVCGAMPTEEDRPDPVGEYAMSCLGRERMFDFYADNGKEEVVHIRLTIWIEFTKKWSYF